MSDYYELIGQTAVPVGDLKRIKVGINEGRRVLDADEAWAPQRGFTKE